MAFSEHEDGLHSLTRHLNPTRLESAEDVLPKGFFGDSLQFIGFGGPEECVLRSREDLIKHMHLGPHEDVTDLLMVLDLRTNELLDSLSIQSGDILELVKDDDNACSFLLGHSLGRV